MSKKTKIVQLNSDDLAKELPEITGESDILARLNVQRITEAEKRLTEAKEKLSKKVYAIKFENSEDLDYFINFMHNDAEWREKESLGVIEICKILDKAKKEGIKQNTLYFGALPMEASHYFISKISGKGLKDAESFIRMLRPFSQALESAQADASEIQGLERELAAAQQGLDLQ
jgi:hypothetical protein